MAKTSGIINALAPQAIAFQNNRLQLGDQMAKIIVITDFPTSTDVEGWLARTSQMAGVAVSMHISPTDPTDLINAINKAIGEYMSRLAQGGNALVLQRAEQSLNDAEMLLKKIDQEQQNVFYLSVVLLVTADDEENLIRRTRKVQASLAGQKMRGREMTFRMEKGLFSVAPWGILDPAIQKSGGRNMPSETIAAAFPFVASGLNDTSGTMLGRDRDGGLVIVDIWGKGGDRGNSNITLLGKSGMGKSFTAKMLLLREYIQGAKVIIIDPEREYRDMCRNIGGSWINVAGGSGKINPLHVRILPTDTEDEEDTEFTATNALDMHLQVLRTFFSLYLKDLTDVEKAILEDSITAVYAEKGITKETDPEEVPADQFPTTGDLYEYILKQAEKKPELFERLSILLKRAALGADAGLWNGATTALPDSDFIVLDVHNLQNAEDAVKSAQYFNVLSYAWNLIEQDRSSRIILMVDEAWMLVDERTPQAIAFLRDTAKRIRKYEGCLIVASQNIIDFLDPAVIRYGQAILDNPTYKLLLGQGEKDLLALEELMNLTEAESDLLASAKRGEGLFVAGSQRIHLRVEAAPHEFTYLTGGGN